MKNAILTKPVIPANFCLARTVGLSYPQIHAFLVTLCGTCDGYNLGHSRAGCNPLSWLGKPARNDHRPFNDEFSPGGERPTVRVVPQTALNALTGDSRSGEPCRHGLYDGADEPVSSVDSN